MSAMAPFGLCLSCRCPLEEREPFKVCAECHAEASVAVKPAPLPTKLQQNLASLRAAPNAPMPLVAVTVQPSAVTVRQLPPKPPTMRDAFQRSLATLPRAPKTVNAVPVQSAPRDTSHLASGIDPKTAPEPLKVHAITEAYHAVQRGALEATQVASFARAFIAGNSTVRRAMTLELD